ncbi:MAG: undecaprenyl-diphosphate phosphatase [Nanoarchaeota archaeon]
MDLISSLILAVVQGILEWFPVSSSGHMALVGKLIESAADFAFEMALNFGTLMAVFVYFRKDIIMIVRDILNGKWLTDNSKLGFLILVASIPAGIFGFIFRSYFDVISGNLFILGSGWLVTSVVLFIGSFSKSKNKNASQLSYFRAFVIGITQAFAIIPGVSRSGMTLSSGLFFGLKEKQAILFSYLLAIPVIIGANLVTFGNKVISADFLLPTIVTFVIGLVFMNFSFKYVLNDRKNLKWFGIYTLLLGIVSLILGAV